MDPYRPKQLPAGATCSAVRRKRRSESGDGRKHKHQDPILELMMCDLMERQSMSSSGAANHKPEPEQIVMHQPSCNSIPPGGTLVAAPKTCCCGLWQQLWFKITLFLFLLVVVVLAIALPVGLSRAAKKGGMQPPQYGLGPRLNTSGLALVFADDFTSFDTATWNVEIGDGQDYGLDSWGNQELQCYTSSPNSLDVIPHPDYPQDDGVLRIRPVYSPTPQQCTNLRAPSSTRQWTSAKIDTKNKIAFTWAGKQVYKGPYDAASPANNPGVGAGHRRALLANSSAAATTDRPSTDNSTCGFIVVESRMKLPVAAGRWSALWMMPRPQPCPHTPGSGGECGAFGPWPASGEIDMIEQVNTDANVLGTIHYADKLGLHRYLGGSVNLAQEALLGWNIFQLVWDCRSITWYVNTMQVNQVTKQQVGAAVWPFDKPFFLILNTAVGGLLTGSVTPYQGESQPFLVDYVRVYAR